MEELHFQRSSPCRDDDVVTYPSTDVMIPSNEAMDDQNRHGRDLDGTDGFEDEDDGDG